MSRCGRTTWEKSVATIVALRFTAADPAGEKLSKPVMDYYEPRDDLDSREDADDHEKEESAIRTCFQGSTVFMTGGSGLVGKVLLEKILRTCPEVKKVILLLRAKKGKSPNDRMIELFQDDLFRRLRDEEPMFLSRMVAMAGDCSLPECGISDEDRETLIGEVNFVYHIAASLRLDESLRVAYNTNVRSTKYLLGLGEQMPKLKAFIYVSTAYSQTGRLRTNEEFYGTPYKDCEIEYLLNNMKDDKIAALSPKLMGSSTQNTYAFTKAKAEDVVRSYLGKIPVGIVRPSVVMGCAYEPLLGWINNIYGATGVLLGSSLGFIRVWYCDPYAIADLIPVDIVVNATMAATWDISENIKTDGMQKFPPPIYNTVSCNKAPITWNDLMEHVYKRGKEDQYVMSACVGVYDFRLQNNKYMYYIQSFYMHLVRGLFYDFILKAMGKKTRLTNGFIKLYNFNKRLGPYSKQNWQFGDNNVDELWLKLNKMDRKIYKFNMGDFSWDAYFIYTLRGIRTNLLKDPEETLPAARQKYSRLLMINRVTNFIILAACFAVYYYR